MRITILFFIAMIFTACVEETTVDYDLQGHRGARGILPENTVPSFLIAIDLGVDTIELDLVVTADNRLLVSHEPWFNHQISSKPDGEPVTEEEQMSLNIYEMTFLETLRYDVGKRGHPNFPNQLPMEIQKPLLREVVTEVDRYTANYDKKPVRFNIETKSRPEWYGEYTPQPEEFSRLLYEEIVELDIADRVTIQSFDPATLIAMRKLDPNITQAMLVYDERTVPEYLNVLGYTPEIWSPHYELVTPEMVAEVHSLGMKIIPWTINEREEMERLLKMGVDGIITDYPDRAP